MNLTGLIDIKERIAIGKPLDPEQRDFVLQCINEACELKAPEALHDPGNYIGRIDKLWAFFSVDAGGEGLCAGPIGALYTPLVCADRKHVDMMRTVARKIANASGKVVRLVKFTTRDDIEIIRP